MPSSCRRLPLVGARCRTALFVLMPCSRCWSVKVFVFCWFQLLIRWSLPRFRSDQLMHLGWQRLLPSRSPTSSSPRSSMLWLEHASRGACTMAVGVKVVTRPGSLSAADVPCRRSPRAWASRFQHFVKNFFGNVTGQRAKTDIATIEYPEEKKTYPERFRGLHRLMLRDDGQVRCVACMMCPTVCPAHCITIVAGGGARRQHREAPEDLRDRRAPLRGLRPVRRGVPVRRDPHGHAASTPSRPTAASTGSSTRRS